MRSVAFSRSALFALVAASSLAHAGTFIRPDSATATSEFSSSFSIQHAINGNGLPAGFSSTSEHADYASNNHWTTRLNQTIGQSATFTFTTPKTIGGFHMWAHRSNVIANNPNYAVTLFDLVLRDSGGTILATFSNLTGERDIKTAQTSPFTQTANVKSVQFIVKATANGNVSPYTGLAEVAFTDCVEPIATPVSAKVAACPTAVGSIRGIDDGTRPLSGVWSVESPAGSGSFAPVQDGINTLASGLAFTASGLATDELLVSNVTLGAHPNAIVFVRRIENMCGNSTTSPIVFSLCPADASCDGFLSFEDFDEFVFAFEAGESRADFNEDGFLTFEDFDAFVTAFEAGC